MAISIIKNAKFAHLNADRSLTIKPGGVGVEKEAVVDITITGATDFSSGLVVVDFTQVGFKQVYSCIIEEQDDHGTNYYQFVEAALSDAATCEIEGRAHTDDALVADATTVVITAIIRGV